MSEFTKYCWGFDEGEECFVGVLGYWKSKADSKAWIEISRGVVFQGVEELVGERERGDQMGDDGVGGESW